MGHLTDLSSPTTFFSQAQLAKITQEFIPAETEPHHTFAVILTKDNQGATLQADFIRKTPDHEWTLAAAYRRTTEGDNVFTTKLIYSD